MKKTLLILFILISSLFAGFEKMDVLSPEDAFNVQAAQKGDMIQTTIKLGDKIYVYDEYLKYHIIKPKEVDLDKDIKRPKPENFHDFIVHRGKDIKVNIPLSLIKEKVGDGKFTLQIDYQGCSEKGLCYQPLHKTFTFSTKNSTAQTATKTTPVQQTPAQDVSEEDQIVNALKGGSLLTILSLFFGFGLLLSLTPCIFPMIPILSSIIVSQSTQDKQMSVSRGLFLSSVYVLSMAVAYTIAGVMAGLFGANIQTALQNPWVLSLFALLFVALAFSMFGYYEIQLPQALQSKITKTSDSAKGKGGLLGVAIMGFLSALIVGPCVAPALAGALVYIGQTGDALLGGAALFVMSLGMGVPLLIVGAGAGKFMPRPGGWMTLVSQIFGVVMLGVAIWMLERIIPPAVTLFLWGLLFSGSAIYMGALEPFKEGIANEKKLIKVFGIVLLLIGLLEIVGAFTGASNPLKPLEKLTSSTVLNSETTTQNKTQFKIIKNITQLKEAVKNSKKPVMLDFSADWCAACKELEHNTFSNQKVEKLMSNFTLLRADVTQNSDEDKALLKKFNLFGPPALIFYDTNGKMLHKYKTIGYKPPEVFIPILEKVLGR